jgi:hypothetical protein
MLCYVMLCYVMLCYMLLCYVKLYYVMLCYVMLGYVMLCYVKLCYDLWSNIMWKSTNLILASCRLIVPTVYRRRQTSNRGTLGVDSTLQPQLLYRGTQPVNPDFEYPLTEHCLKSISIIAEPDTAIIFASD